MLRFHRERKALATLLLHQRAKSNSVVSLDDGGRIIRLPGAADDATRQGVVSPWVNSGVCICEPEFFGRDTRRGGVRSATRCFFQKLMGSGGYWISIEGLPLRGGFAGAVGGGQGRDCGGEVSDTVDEL